MDNNTYTTCQTNPPRMYSFGIFGGDYPIKYPFAAFQLQILVIFTLTQLIHYPLGKCRFPKILAEIIAGVILGPTMPEIVQHYTQKLFPPESQEIIATISIFGFGFLLFLIGVTSDMSLITRVGKRETSIGVSTIVVPFIMGFIIVMLLGKHDPNLPKKSMLLVVGVQSLSPFSGIALLLKNLKLLNSEIGRLALSSAAICEMINAVTITIVTAVKSFVEINSIFSAVSDVGLFICFIFVTIFLIRPIMLWIVKQTPEGENVRNEYLYVVVLMALVACVFTQTINQHALLGAFIIGLVIPDGPPLGSSLVYYLDTFISGICVPLYVTIVSSKVDLKILYSYPYTGAFMMMLPLVFTIKLLAGFIPALIWNVPVGDAVVLGLIMCTKSVVELATYSLARGDENLKDVTMGVVIITVAITALVTTMLVRNLYDPRRKYGGNENRSISHTKIDDELKIVACVHRTDNTNGYINLFDALGPTKKSPMEIFVLNLIELTGRVSPIFITHQLQKIRPVSGISYSEEMVLAFHQYEMRNKGSISTKCFTAVSPRELMYEDICNLAFNKLASFLIVPFHQKWDIQGSVESEDNGLRALNQKILDVSPCSVGIFLDRGLVSNESSYSVAMIFIGGKDDREALAYAKRIARSPNINLTVIHFVSEELEEDEDKTWERILDNEELKGIKNDNNIDTEHVFYAEEKVRDGPETALKIRSMINEFDLIIVGRGNNEERPQTSGLSEWSEFPELGIIGDFLGSMEGKCKASVLVIQQQHSK